MPDGEFEHRVVATYDYESEDGDLLFQVVRYEPETFGGGSRMAAAAGSGKATRRPRRCRTGCRASPAPAAQPSMSSKAKRTRRPPRLGLVATCNAGGAGKWPEHFADYFYDCAVVILPDNDPPGLAHADLVARNLAPVAASVRIVELPGLPVKGDVADCWLPAARHASCSRWPRRRRDMSRRPFPASETTSPPRTLRRRWSPSIPPRLRACRGRLAGGWCRTGCRWRA